MLARSHRPFRILAALGAGVLALGGGAAWAVPQASVALNGAGSTFVAPLMTGGWIPGYTAKHGNVQVNYNGTGSSAGISLWTAGKVDFAASDALLTSGQEMAARTTCRSGVVKVPVTIGAVALVYNLPSVKTGLKLTPDVVAGIFMGKIVTWNDPSITRLNPGMTLPRRPIQVVHRSDGSGTSYITTNYLSRISGDWKARVGAGSTVAWPVGLGAKGSAGISALVASTPGAISYVDLAYAIKNNLTYAWVRNKAGNYVAPSTDSASVAAYSFAGSMPSDLQQVIVNSPASKAYPITGYSYIFLCDRQYGDRGRTLVDFVTYAVTDGQADAAPRYYAPLPTAVQAKDVAALKSTTVK